MYYGHSACTMAIIHVGDYSTCSMAIVDVLSPYYMHYGHSTRTMARVHVLWPEDMSYFLYGSVPSPCRSGSPGNEAPWISKGGLGRQQASPTATPPPNEGGFPSGIKARVYPPMHCQSGITNSKARVAIKKRTSS